MRADLSSLGGVKDDDFVCWRVLSDNSAQPEDVWKNRTVINSYINYCQKSGGCIRGKSALLCIGGIRSTGAAAS